MSKRLTFSSLVKFGSKNAVFLLDSLCTRQLYLVCDRSTAGKRGKLAISAPVTYCPDLIQGAIRGISGARAAILMQGLSL